jgi:hypothetical protein
MKKEHIFTILLSLLLVSPLVVGAQEIEFERWFGGANYDYGYSVAQDTTDDGYIITGWTASFSSGDWNVYLIKTNSYGDTLWTMAYGGADYDYGRSVVQTDDGGFILAGSTSSFGEGLSDVYLIKTNPYGDTLWTKTFGGVNYDYGYSVAQTDDGGYIITGHTFSFGAGSCDVYLIKTNSYGDTLWTKTFGGVNYDYGYSVAQTDDGGYIITGYTYSFGAGSEDVYLIRTDPTGDTLWTNTFGGTDVDQGYSVAQTDDGEFIVTGQTFSFGASWSDLYLIKTDTAGNMLWQKTFGGTNFDCGYSVKQTKDGGYIIAGQTKSFGAGSSDVYLIKTDENGDMLWQETLGGIYDDYGYSVAQTDDEGYIITGYTLSFGIGTPNYPNVYLIKIAAEQPGVHDNEDITPTLSLFQNFPNPFSTSTKISFNLDHRDTENAEIKIYNIKGQLIKEFKIKNSKLKINEVVWDGTDERHKPVPAGIYLLKLEVNGKETEAKKCLLIR